MLEDGGLCVECLGSQYYDPVTQLCKQCDSSCTACDGPGPSSCIACTYPLHLDKISKRCVPCCTERHSNDCCNCDNATGKRVLSYSLLYYLILFRRRRRRRRKNTVAFSTNSTRIRAHSSPLFALFRVREISVTLSNVQRSTLALDHDHIVIGHHNSYKYLPNRFGCSL